MFLKPKYIRFFISKKVKDYRQEWDCDIKLLNGRTDLRNTWPPPAPSSCVSMFLKRMWR